LEPSTKPILGPGSGFRLSKSWIVILTCILILGTAISPFILEGQMNGLVVILGFLAIPGLMLLRLPPIGDIFWAALSLTYLLIAVLAYGELERLTSVGYTIMLTSIYLVFSGALSTYRVTPERFRKVLEVLIKAYAMVSLVQMLASLAGIPVPNEILSKGLWSYNSLAVEPSHAARILAISMLAYIVLVYIEHGKTLTFSIIWHMEKSVIIAFLISISLTGSALGVAAIFTVLLLLLRPLWRVVILLAIIVVWPVLLSVEVESIRRLMSFISVLPTMNIDRISAADHSGAIRVMPLILYVEQAHLDSLSTWFGGGFSSIASYVQGRMIGVKADSAMAGFVPGYIMVTGILGCLIFLYAFIFRFLNKETSTLVVLWVLLIATAAWNSQVFWFGIIILRAVYHYSEKARKSVPVTSSSKLIS